MSYYENAVRLKEAVYKAGTYLNDEQAETCTELFPSWHEDTPYGAGDRRKYDGLLYKCVQAHTSQTGWEPSKAPALWIRTSVDEWPEWIQPVGAHDRYMTGDKVTHAALHWISSVDNNIWEPGIYGWDPVN